MITSSNLRRPVLAWVLWLIAVAYGCVIAVGVPWLLVFRPAVVVMAIPLVLPAFVAGVLTGDRRPRQLRSAINIIREKREGAR